MSDRFHVATRKGLFTVERKAGGWVVAGAPAFLGDPVTMVLNDRRDDTLYAALNLGHFGVKLRRSDDAGESWDELEAPAHAPQGGSDLDATPSAPSVKQIWALEPGGADEPGLLWAGTLPGGLFRSSDRGESWGLVDSLWERPERAQWFGGGYDDPGIHSICVDPRDPKHITVGVSCGGVWETRDSGGSWECKTKGMYAEYMPPEKREEPAIQDPHRVVQCLAAPETLWVQHHNGAFRSTDGAATWNEITEIAPSKFGFTVVAHPKEKGTAWFVPAVKDECRVPVDGRVVVARTRDGGKSFDVLRDGLPQEHSYDLVYRHAMDIDESGDRLAMGSTTGGLWVSENQGDSWTSVSEHFPPIYQVRFA